MSSTVFIGMVLCNISAMICFSVVAPILPIELKNIDFEKEQLGYMFAAYSLPSIIGSLICGEILSKYGRRIILFFSILVMAISTITFSYVNDLSSKETIIYVICGIRAIEGLSAGFIYCAVYSIIAITFKCDQVKYLAYIEASEAATMILGPAVGAAMYELFGFKVVFWILGVFDLLVAITIMICVPKYVDTDDEELEEENESNVVSRTYEQTNPLNVDQNMISEGFSHEQTTNIFTGKSRNVLSVSYVKLLCNPLIMITAIAHFISCFEYCYLEPILALRLDKMELNETQIGLFFLIFGVSYTFSTLSLSYFTDRFEIKGIIWKSMLLCGFANLLVGPSKLLPNSIILMGLGQFLNGILEVFFMTTCLPVMIEEGEELYPHNKLEVADKASAIVNCMSGIGQGLGPIYGSYISALIGFRNTADSISCLLIGYSIIFCLVLRYYIPTKKESSEKNEISQPKLTEDVCSV